MLWKYNLLLLYHSNILNLFRLWNFKLIKSILWYLLSSFPVDPYWRHTYHWICLIPHLPSQMFWFSSSKKLLHFILFLFLILEQIFKILVESCIFYYVFDAGLRAVLFYSFSGMLLPLQFSEFIMFLTFTSFDAVRSICFVFFNMLSTVLKFPILVWTYDLTTTLLLFDISIFLTIFVSFVLQNLCFCYFFSYFLF